MNRIMKRMALPVGAAIILGSSGFAFMATNTFAHGASLAGDGSQSISGYTVDNVHYLTGKYVDQKGGYWVTGVQFRLNGGASEDNVYSNVYDANGGHAYDECTMATDGLWTCTNSNQTNLAQIKTAASVEVVAAQ